MARYAGIEKVDESALNAQYALIEALWSKLVEQGVRNGSRGEIEAFFVADHGAAAATLAGLFPREGSRVQAASADDGTGKLMVKVVSPEAELTRDALLELVDVMMVAAHHSACVFDGFQVNVSALLRRSWWKFW